MAPRVRFRDLSVSPSEQDELIGVIRDLLTRGELILGPEVDSFERDVAEHCGRNSAVAVSSGTSALYLCLRALNMGPEDEVITTPMSWVATANAIVMSGAKPKFVDVNEDFLLNPHLVEENITSRTRAILPVDFYGRICDRRQLSVIASQHQIPLIIDGAQSFGATRDGARSGQLGDMVAYSLNPMKVFAGIGEAGVIVLDDLKLAEILKSLRYLGTINKETCITPELNHKIDPLHAAVLRHRLENLPALLNARRIVALRYSERLGELEPYVVLPRINHNEEPSYYDYVIRCQHRDELETYLLSLDIEVKVRHRELITKQPAFRDFAAHYTPKADSLVQELLCLPIHEKLTIDQIDLVCKSIRDFYLN